jgi:hypothetical protein
MKYLGHMYGGFVSAISEQGMTTARGQSVAAAACSARLGGGRRRPAGLGGLVGQLAAGTIRLKFEGCFVSE